MKKRFNVIFEKYCLILKKHAAILQFEERLEHGNVDSYLPSMRLHLIPNNAYKTDLERNKMDSIIPIKP